MAKRLGRVLNLAFLVLGLGLLVGLLVGLDLAEVRARLVQVGWWFGPAFGFYVLGLLLTSWAWWRIVDPRSSTASYAQVAATFWAGHAIAQLTPAGILGDVLKGSILRQRIRGEALVASLITFNFLSMTVVGLFTLLGPLLCLVALRLSLAVELAIFGAALVMFVPLVVFFLLLRWGLASKAVGLFTRLPFVRIADPQALVARARAIDRRIVRFRRERPRAFQASVAVLFAVRLTQVAEVWMLLLGLMPNHGAGFLFLLAVLVQTASQLLSWLVAFVPGQIGVAEGGSALLFGLLGLDPLVGFAMELLRRLRKVLGISIGLGIGSWLGARPFKADLRPAVEEPQEVVGEPDPAP